MKTKQTEPGTDLRYKVVKVFIEERRIRTFKSIFKYIPKTVVREDMGFHHYRMDRFIDNPSEFELRYIDQLAAFIGIDTTILTDMIGA